jgi:hypothetical protein
VKRRDPPQSADFHEVTVSDFEADGERTKGDSDLWTLI